MEAAVNTTSASLRLLVSLAVVQRYWVDESYYNPQLPGPLFVQLGEEAEASAGMASSMAMATYGQMHGALLVVRRSCRPIALSFA